jgi:hypothetical protein
MIKTKKPHLSKLRYSLIHASSMLQPEETPKHGMNAQNTINTISPKRKSLPENTG